LADTKCVRTVTPEEKKSVQIVLNHQNRSLLLG